MRSYSVAQDSSQKPRGRLARAPIAARPRAPAPTRTHDRAHSAGRNVATSPRTRARLARGVPHKPRARCQNLPIRGLIPAPCLKGRAPAFFFVLEGAALTRSPRCDAPRERAFPPRPGPWCQGVSFRLRACLGTGEVRRASCTERAWMSCGGEAGRPGARQAGSQALDALDPPGGVYDACGHRACSAPRYGLGTVRNPMSRTRCIALE